MQLKAIKEGFKTLSKRTWLLKRNRRESFTKTSSKCEIPITTIKDHGMGKRINLEGGMNTKISSFSFSNHKTHKDTYTRGFKEPRGENGA